MIIGDHLIPGALKNMFYVHSGEKCGTGLTISPVLCYK